jgi:hypothetical protein
MRAKTTRKEKKSSAITSAFARLRFQISSQQVTDHDDLPRRAFDRVQAGHPPGGVDPESSPKKRARRGP